MSLGLLIIVTIGISSWLFVIYSILNRTIIKQIKISVKEAVEAIKQNKV